MPGLFQTGDTVLFPWSGMQAAGCLLGSARVSDGGVQVNTVGDLEVCPV